MTSPAIKAKHLYPGDVFTAAQWNALRRAVVDILREQLATAQPLRGHLPAAAVMMRIKSSNGDYWTCRRYDGTTEQTEDVKVAKPWELRPSVTAIGSQTYSYTNDAERVATESSVDETQVVVPSWTVDETVIWAARARDTGVAASGQALNWLDLNVAGRAWAKKAA